MSRNSKEQNTYLIMKRIVRDYLAPHKKRLVIAIFCMMIVAGCTALTAWMIRPIIDEIFINRNEWFLYVLPTATLAIFLIKGAASYTQTYFMEYIGQRIIANIQSQLYTHVIKSDLQLFHSETSSKLSSRFVFDINQLKAASSNVIIAAMRDVTMIIGLIGVMIYQNWQMALMAFTIIPIAAFPIIKFGRRVRKYALGTQEEMGSFMDVLNESLGHIRQVKTYTMEPYEIQRSNNSIERIFTLLMKMARVRALSSPVMEFLAGIIIAVIMFYGGLQVWHEEMTTGAFLSFLTSAMTIYRPLKSVTNINNQLQVAVAAAVRTFELMDTKPEVECLENTGDTLKVSRGDVAFNAVDFNYADGTPALKGIGFTAAKGETVALVGSSGAGKSSILNLIPRFFDVSSGSITIDGQDIKDVSIKSLRENIALVTQDVAIFNDTIANNIAYGKPDASRDEIIAAAKKANAHDFIETFDKGYETLAGEQGLKLSGGQKQRIAIARAILKNAPILLLDEATSALDTESEKHVQEALMNLMHGRTTLVVAHRLSTIMDADNILVMDKGAIIEHGTHDALLEKDGRYMRLFKLQDA